MLNDRIRWQEEVEAHFEEGMARLKEFDTENAKEKLLVSYLSDIQELVALNPMKACEHINRVKFMINNCN
jgi:hypothetical protein